MKQLQAYQRKPALRALGRYLLYVVGIPLVFVPAVNLVFEDPAKDDLKAWVRAAINTNNPARAKEASAKLIAQAPLNVRYHITYVRAHFDQPKRSGNEERNDQQLYQEYFERTQHADSNVADLGRLGLGLYHWEKKQYDESLSWLGKVQNRKLWYLNYLKGMAQRKLKRYDEAEQSLRKEIEYAGYVRAAVYRLGLLLDDRGKYSALERLYLEPEHRPHLPHQILRRLHWRHLRLGGYLKILVLPIKKNSNLPGFWGAVLITIVWLYFLKRLDIFEPEKNRYLLLTFLGGMLMALAAPFFYDMLKFYLGFDLSGRWPNDLLYCIFGIGLVEEFVKAVPFLLMVILSRQVNESVDFIIYAAVSALGFSFVENLLYFDERSLFIMNERGMVCSIGHMFDSCLIGYGIILAKYRKSGKVVCNVLFFFLLACLFHGIYDFWLVCESVPDEFGMFSFLLAMIEVIIFNRMINNALNQSEFFDEKELDRLNHMRERLGISLMTIVMFEYLCLVWKYGPQLTYAQFAEVIGLTWFLVFFLSFNLTHYILRQGRWKPLFSRRRSHDAGG